MVKLTLPLPPNIANARMHFWTKHRKKLAYWSLCNVMAMAKTFPRPPKLTPVKVEVTVTFYLWAHMDEGNAFARLKWIEDWLVEKGYATDDSPKHWQYSGIPGQVIDRKNPRVELTIQEVP